MATALELAKLPFTAAWYLLKLLFLPALIVTVAYLVVGPSSPWFTGIALLTAVWAAVLVRLWLIKLRGVLRSLARGTIRISGHDLHSSPRRRGRRRRGGPRRRGR